jgi:hypothetical protein
MVCRTNVRQTYTEQRQIYLRRHMVTNIVQAQAITKTFGKQSD